MLAKCLGYDLLYEEFLRIFKAKTHTQTHTHTTKEKEAVKTIVFRS